MEGERTVNSSVGYGCHRSVGVLVILLVLLAGCGERIVPYMGGAGGGGAGAPSGGSGVPIQPAPPTGSGSAVQPVAPQAPPSPPPGPPAPVKLEKRPVRIELPPGSPLKADELVPFTVYSATTTMAPGAQTIPAPEGEAIVCFAQTATGDTPLACLSMPAAPPQQAEVVLNADSTALASMLTMPLIAQDTLEELDWACSLVRTRPSFAQLVGAVGSALTKPGSLPQENVAVRELRAKVMNEYFEELDRVIREGDVSVFGGVTYQATATTGPGAQRPTVTPPAESGGFSVAYGGLSNENQHVFRVTNSNRRTGIALSPSIDSILRGFEVIGPGDGWTSLKGILNRIKSGSFDTTTEIRLLTVPVSEHDVHIVTYRFPLAEMTAPDPSCVFRLQGTDIELDGRMLQYCSFSLDLFDCALDGLLTLAGVGKVPKCGRTWTREKILVTRFLGWVCKEMSRFTKKGLLGQDISASDMWGLLVSLTKWLIEPDVLRPLCNLILETAHGAAWQTIANAAKSFLLPYAGIVMGVRLAAFLVDVIQRTVQARAALPDGPWKIRLDGKLQAPTTGTATVLVMDASGSMGLAGKIDAAKQAADQLLEFIAMLNSAGMGHRVGLVVFDHGIRQSAELGLDMTAIRSEVADVFPDGGTNLLLPLQQALDLMADAPSTERNVILMTDGIDESNNSDDDILAACVSLSGAIPVNTVAFGDDADRVLLTQVAAQTGGQFFDAADAMGLRASYLRAVQTEHAVIDISGSVKTNQRISLGRVSLSAVSPQNAFPATYSSSTRVGSAHRLVRQSGAGPAPVCFQTTPPGPTTSGRALAASLNWDTGRVSLEVKDPTGKLVDATYPGAQIRSDAVSTLAVIADPVEGPWQFAIKGDDCPAEGSNYQFTALAVGIEGSVTSSGGGGGPSPFAVERSSASAVGSVRKSNVQHCIA